MKSLVKIDRDYLDSLRLKSDVIEVAENLELETAGTRAEIEDRILAFSEETAGAEAAEEEDDNSEVVGSQEGLQDCTTTPTVESGVVALPQTAVNFSCDLIKSFVGADVDADVLDEGIHALRAGIQVVVVRNADREFVVQVDPDRPFDPSDPTTDVKDGVSCHINRMLVDKKLYPRG